MSTIIRVLIDAKTAEAVQTTQFTAEGTTVIDRFTATNVSGAAATLTVNIVKSGEASILDNTILSAREVAAGESYTCPELCGQALNSGDYITTTASASGAIVIRASGREISA